MIPEKEPGLTTNPLISIIVPAYNEQVRIRDALDALLAQDLEGWMDVIVIANGCHDRTADVANEYVSEFRCMNHRLTVLELPSPGKCAAINAAEERLSASVRIYMDADVTLAPNAVRSMHTALSGGFSHLVAPQICIECGRSWLTRSFFRAWSATPAVREGVIGAGVLAVSVDGRRRWERFPMIVADDAFVRMHFQPDERCVLQDTYFALRPPEGVRELIEVRSRWRRGGRELEQLQDVMLERASRNVQSLMRQPRLWRDLPTYALVNALARMLARWRNQRGPDHWERSRRSRDRYD